MLLISELGVVSSHPRWYSSLSRLTAIYWSKDHLESPCLFVRAGRDFVVVCCEGTYLISVYVSPNQPLVYFFTFLDQLRSILSELEHPRVIIGGDFNSKSPLWGCSSENRRGRILSDWMAERDFRICNLGDNAMCVRPQGSSIVDLTWVSTACNDYVLDRHLIVGIETLSDHKYIFFNFSGARRVTRGPPLRCYAYPRWSFQKFKRDLFEAVLEWKCDSFNLDRPVEELAANLGELIERGGM